MQFSFLFSTITISLCSVRSFHYLSLLLIYLINYQQRPVKNIIYSEQIKAPYFLVINSWPHVLGLVQRRGLTQSPTPSRERRQRSSPARLALWPQRWRRASSRSDRSSTRLRTRPARRSRKPSIVTSVTRKQLIRSGQVITPNLSYRRAFLVSSTRTRTLSSRANRERQRVLRPG